MNVDMMLNSVIHLPKNTYYPHTLGMTPMLTRGVRICSVCKVHPVKADGEAGCFHAFCPDCYLTWIHQAKECPLCCIDEEW